MTNPLMAYAIPDQVYTHLVAGRYYPVGVLSPDVDLNEIGIKPMSARDEYMFNNPSALMNGKAVESVIRNCVPDILQPQKLCVNDVEILLLGIYKASGHNTYSVSATCPKCEKVGEFERNIDATLNTASIITTDHKYLLPSGVEIHLRPSSWANNTRTQRIAFEQQKLARLAASDDNSIDDDKKMSMFAGMYDSMVQLNFDIILDSINHITTPDGTKVHSKEHVKEFVESLNKEQVQKIKELVADLNDIGVTKEMEVACSFCGHEWNEKGMRFDPSYFFE